MSWQPHHQLIHRRIPVKLKEWLLDRGSLTDRLFKASGGNFHVKLLNQHWGVAKRDEAQLLGLRPRQAALIREVLLYGNNSPWVYARSILPAQSLDRSLRHLKRLGNKPLGTILFDNPHMQRSDIEVTLIDPKQLPVNVDGPVWGRRSIFFIDQKPLLVSEVFLPVFVQQL